MLCWKRTGDIWELPDLAGAASLSTTGCLGRQICGVMPDHSIICTAASPWGGSLPGPPPEGLADVASVDCNQQHCCALRLPYA